MSDSQPGNGLRLLNAAEVREKQTITVDVGNGNCVVAKKLDMTTLVFEGLVPMPLLTAVQRMVEMRDATPAERVLSMPDDDKRSMVNLLRRHAVKAVVQPQLVEIDDGQPNHLPVDLLELTSLLAIWNATAIIPMMEPAAAAEFRPGPVAVPPFVVQPREDLSPAAESLAAPDAEVRYA